MVMIEETERAYLFQPGGGQLSVRHLVEHALTNFSNGQIVISDIKKIESTVLIPIKKL